MKNIIIIILAAVFLLPLGARADSFDFQPWLKLFKQIVSEKDIKINELTQEISFLKSNKSLNTIQCPQVLGKTNNDSAIKKLKKDNALTKNAIDTQILELRKEIDRENAIFYRKGSGVTASEINTRNRIENENNIKIRNLENQKSTLDIELRKKLIDLGEF